MSKTTEEIKHKAGDIILESVGEIKDKASADFFRSIEELKLKSSEIRKSILNM